MPYSPFSSSPSSPASSPSFGPVDSSPLSSPIINSTTLDSPSASPGVIHPFAASTKAIKPLRLYEKRENRWGADLTDNASSETTADEDGTTRYDFDASMTACALSETETDDFFADDATESIVMEEHDLWERSISDAIDQGNGLINLSSTSFGGGITTIPPSIADLEKLVVLPGPSQQSRLSPAPYSVYSSPTKALSRGRALGRAATAPTLFGGRGAIEKFILPSRDSPSGSKAVSSSQGVRFTTAHTSNEVQLYIANHSIRSLPTELFWITNLTVLSLRGNKLTSVPPQIATSLPHLRELNVSLNELVFLPAEILGLRLEFLAVAGNPWMSPAKSLETSKNTLSKPTSVSNLIGHAEHDASHRPLHTKEIVRHFTIPPLTELCFRVLMAPVTPILHSTCLASREHIPSQKREFTVLENRYEVPLVRIDFAPLIIDTVYGCIPRSITDQRKVENKNSDTIIQGSPTKKARTGYSPTMFRNNLFVSPSSSPSPFTASRMLSTRPRERTRSHVSFVSSHSRSSTSRSSKELSKPAHPGISICPSPLHLGQLGKPVYVRHAVERFTWEDEIAGVKMGETNGVPVLWRGCGPRCLDWLDEQPEDHGADVVAGRTDANEHSDEGTASVEEVVMDFQPADLSQGFADAFYDSD